MIRSLFCMPLCLLWASMACAQTPATPPAKPAAHAQAGAAKVQTTPHRVAMAVPHKRRHHHRRHHDGHRSQPIGRVDSANHLATREPLTQAFVNAVQVYPWSEGALYRLYAAPERVTDIALQVGETLVAVAAGDTARWTVGDTSSGSGTTKRTHILVKPFASGLTSNLIITTDRRSYHLQLESTAASAMAALSWTYPQDELLALNHDAAASEAAQPIASGVPLESLRFGYTIEGDQPVWRPLRAFDDGRQTYIEFPKAIAQDEAPPLFVIGPTGSAELVNYRLRGNFYVVDRLFAAAELRLGTKPQSVVRITRTDAAAMPRRGRKHA